MNTLIWIGAKGKRKKKKRWEDESIWNIFIQLINTRLLWKTYKRVKINSYQEEAQKILVNEAMHVIPDILSEKGNSCSRICLHQPTWNYRHNWSASSRMVWYWSANLCPERKCQCRWCSTIKSCFYVDPADGQGQIFTFNFLCDYARTMHLRVWTEITTILLSRKKKTIYCLFKLLVRIIETSAYNISSTWDDVAFIRNQILFVIDDCLMISVNALIFAIDKCLKDSTEFNGKK